VLIAFIMRKQNQNNQNEYTNNKSSNSYNSPQKSVLTARNENNQNNSNRQSFIPLQNSGQSVGLSLMSQNTLNITPDWIKNKFTAEKYKSPEETITDDSMDEENIKTPKKEKTQKKY